MEEHGGGCPHGCDDETPHDGKEDAWGLQEGSGGMIVRFYDVERNNEMKALLEYR